MFIKDAFFLSRCFISHYTLNAGGNAEMYENPIEILCHPMSLTTCLECKLAHLFTVFSHPCSDFITVLSV